MERRPGGPSRGIPPRKRRFGKSQDLAHKRSDESQPTRYSLPGSPPPQGRAGAVWGPRLRPRGLTWRRSIGGHREAETRRAALPLQACVQGPSAGAVVPPGGAGHETQPRSPVTCPKRQAIRRVLPSFRRGRGRHSQLSRHSGAGRRVPRGRSTIEDLVGWVLNRGRRQAPAPATRAVSPSVKFPDQKRPGSIMSGFTCRRQRHGFGRGLPTREFGAEPDIEVGCFQEAARAPSGARVRSQCKFSGPPAASSVRITC